MAEFKTKLRIKVVHKMREFYEGYPPSEEEYRQARINQALTYTPSIYPCGTCKWPVVQGYCCNYCGAVDPEERKAA